MHWAELDLEKLLKWEIVHLFLHWNFFNLNTPPLPPVAIFHILEVQSLEEEIMKFLSCSVPTKTLCAPFLCPLKWWNKGTIVVKIRASLRLEKRHWYFTGLFQARVKRHPETARIRENLDALQGISVPKTMKKIRISNNYEGEGFWTYTISNPEEKCLWRQNI